MNRGSEELLITSTTVCCLQCPQHYRPHSTRSHPRHTTMLPRSTSMASVQPQPDHRLQHYQPSTENERGSHVWWAGTPRDTTLGDQQNRPLQPPSSHRLQRPQAEDDGAAATPFICCRSDVRNLGTTCNYVATTHATVLRFPKEIHLRNQLEVAHRREGFSANDTSRLSSEDFRQEDFDCTGQTMRIRNGALPSVFRFPTHLQRDHSYTLPTSLENLRARLNETLSRVESMEREKKNAKDRERRVKNTVLGLLQNLRENNLINEEQKKRLDLYSAYSKMSAGNAHIGKPAPDFKATAVMPDKQFKDIQLSDYRGKYVVFFFYPLDFTFVCPTEIIAYSDRADEFKKINCEVIGASVDSHFCHLAWINSPRKQGGLGQMNIPLVADTLRTISKDYGVLKEDEGIAFRGLFIIDDKGILRQITINDLPVGRSVDETLRLVQAFQFTDKHGEELPGVAEVLRARAPQALGRPLAVTTSPYRVELPSSIPVVLKATRAVAPSWSGGGQSSWVSRLGSNPSQSPQ
ncbi:PRDX1 protein, partial [Polypterus senegalus]